MGATAAGALSALPLVAFAAVALVTPRLGRAFGAERVLVAGRLLLVAGTVLCSLGEEAALFVGTALLAVGIGAANVLLPALVRTTVPDRVGLVTSWYAATLTLMAAAASGVAAPIARTSPGGRRTALGCWAVLAAVTALVWAPAALRRGAAAPPGPPGLDRADGLGGPHGPGGGAGSGGGVRAANPWRSPVAWAVAAYFCSSRRCSTAWSRGCPRSWPTGA